ncbi:MAG: hypothetical protein OEY14_05180 [Myxococcales bacterium]|nr:hypothetical protein [Myxococcales bacterium]
MLAALLLLLLLRRGLRRLSLRAAAARAGADGAALPTPVTVRELEDRIGGQADRNRAIVEATRSGAPEEIQILAAELAAEDPTRAARVVQGWLTEGHQADAQEGAEVPQ